VKQMVFLPKTKADGAGGFTSCFLIGHGNTLLLYEQEGKSFLSEAIAKQWAEATARTLITGAKKGKVFRVSGVWYFQDLQGAIRAVGIDDFVIGQGCHVGRL
jgi:hypothetical protein